MLTLSKQFAVTIQSQKPFRNLKVLSTTEHQYLTMRRERVTEVSSLGKIRKLLVSRRDSKILVSGISDCLTLIGGLISTGQIVVCSKMKKTFQSFLLPPQVKLSMELLKPDQCSLYIFEKGLVLVCPNDQIWMWLAEDDLRNPLNVSPHLKGIWTNLNTSKLLKNPSEMNSRRSGLGESKPNSNSSRPPLLKSRYTTHAFSIRLSKDYSRGQVVGVLRVWLRSINEDSCVLESRFLSVNLIEQEKSGLKSNCISSIEEFVFKGPLEFWSKKGHKDMGLVAKLDHSNSIAAIGVNSSHPYFCQLVFLNPSTGKCTTQKLCNYVTVEDIPGTTDGKTSFWIDDLVWSPDDSFVAVAFKAGFVSIFARLGDPLAFIMDIIKPGSEPRIFAHAFFTTDPELIKKNGCFMSVDWKNAEIVISDGYTICELSVSNFPIMSEVVPICIPHEVEVPDISIHISHETNPIPSEMDSGPKRKNLEVALQLLRSCLSNCHSINYKEVIFSITSWIDNVLPPQIHEEINYTSITNSRFETEARLSSNLILKKKMHAIDVLTHFSQIIEMENWSLIHNSDSKEWIMSIAYQVFKYMIADQQALYAWNVLRMFERWADLRFQRIRNMLIVYCLIQYRNHQANHINVVYYLLAYAAVRGGSNSYMPVLTGEEEEFLRIFIKQNLDLNQESLDKQPMVISSLYYLQHRIKDKTEGSLNYLLGYSNNFQSTSQEICAQLIRGNIKYTDSSLGPESLLIFAFFFDPSEPFFISPIEAKNVFSKTCGDVYEMLNQLKKLSQVKVQKEKKFQKDSVFLYWTLGLYHKLEILLPSDVAFYAISKLLPVLDNENCIKAVQALKKLFDHSDYLKLIELCHPALKQVLQHYTLAIMRTKLKSLICTRKYLENKVATKTCNELFPLYSSNEVSEIVKIFKNCLGNAEIIYDKTENWIDLEKSNFSGYAAPVNKIIQDIFRFLWYILVQDQLEVAKLIEWRIRLLSFSEFHDKNDVLELVVGEDSELSGESAVIIALYLRNSMFVGKTQNFQNWKQNIMKMSEGTQILYSLEQPAYMNPWIFDQGFLDFAEKVLGLPISYQSTGDSVVKSWASSVKSLSKQYKVTGFLKYLNGTYSEAKENEDFDNDLFLSIFNDSISALQSDPIKSEIPSFTPPAALKKRLQLKFSTESQISPAAISLQAQISCKKLINTLKASLKQVFLICKPLKQPKQSRAKSSKKDKSPFSLFTLNADSSISKPIGLKFSNLFDQTPKQAKHRRIQSVFLPSVTSQKPFQLIRVQKSHLE